MRTSAPIQKPGTQADVATPSARRTRARFRWTDENQLNELKSRKFIPIERVEASISKPETISAETQPGTLDLDAVPENDIRGYVHSVQKFGTTDGHGLRYVVRLSGCPLSCQYCDNPDTQGQPCGIPITPAEVMEDILRYENSVKNGGLIITGGEPLLQPHFVRELFKIAKARGIHTSLDTSGFLGVAADDELLSYTDLILLDIKSGDPAVYKRTTGVNLAPTLIFARRLDKKAIPMRVRFVLVPGLTDAPSNIEKIAKFVSGLGNVERIQILPFKKMNEYKYEASDRNYKLSETPTPSSSEIQAARDIFSAYGLTTVIGFE